MEACRLVLPSTEIVCMHARLIVVRCSVKFIPTFTSVSYKYHFSSLRDEECGCWLLRISAPLLFLDPGGSAFYLKICLISDVHSTHWWFS